MRRRPLPLLAIAAGVAIALTGCVPVLPFGPTGARSDDRADRSQPRGPAAECVDGRALISEPGEYRLGDCAEVAVEANDIRVELDDVETLSLRGDRLTVEADEVEEVTIEGNDNSMDLDRVESLTVRGDRNEVRADDPSDQVTVEGNENVFAGGSDVVTDRGDRNRIEPSGR
jgi:hypothetical protein